MAIGDHFWNSIPEWETIGIQVTNPKHGKGIWDVTRHPQLGTEVQMHRDPRRSVLSFDTKSL